MSDQVRLRPATEEDLPLLQRIRQEPETAAPYSWFGWHDPGRLHLHWAETGLIADTHGTLLVICGETAIGEVGWRQVSYGPTSHCWNIGITLLPEARGHGYGTQAQRLLVRYLFEHTQVNRVEASTDVTNLPEQRALEKAGFSQEASARGPVRSGRWNDLALYGMLREEAGLG